MSNQLEVGKVVVFTCNGSGRGGHYQVTATVTKVNRKTVKAVEANRSYRPGTNWTIDKTEIEKVRDPVPEHTCTFCKGTGKFTQAGVVYKNKCVMCKDGVVAHESFGE